MKFHVFWLKTTEVLLPTIRGTVTFIIRFIVGAMENVVRS